MTRSAVVFNPFRVWHYNGTTVSERVVFNEADAMDYVRRKCHVSESEHDVEETLISLSEYKCVCGNQVFRITPAPNVKEQFLGGKANLKFRTLRVMDSGTVMGWITVASKRLSSDYLLIQFAYCSAKVDEFNRKKGQFYSYLKLQASPVGVDIVKGLYEKIKIVAVRCAEESNVYWMKGVTPDMLV